MRSIDSMTITPHLDEGLKSMTSQEFLPGIERN